MPGCPKRPFLPSPVLILTIPSLNPPISISTRLTLPHCLPPFLSYLPSTPSLPSLSPYNRTKEGSGLVALWWMHFHRPISVILEKQVWASFSQGFTVLSLPLTPPTPHSVPLFFLPTLSISLSSSTIFRRSLINTPEHWCWPLTLSLKAQLSHIEHPNPFFPMFKPRPWVWGQPSPPKVKDWLTSGPQNNRGPLPHLIPAAAPALSSSGLIGYAATSPSQSISFIWCRCAKHENSSRNFHFL